MERWNSYNVENNVNEIKTFEKPLCVAGDANADCEVNVKDLVRAKKYIADDSTAIFVSAIDLDTDGGVKIDAMDLTELRKLIVK